MPFILAPVTPTPPVLTGCPSNSTITVQSLVKSALAYPEFTPVLGQSGYTQQPALTIANDVMQRFLAQPMHWKFNRQYVSPFLTVALQQDYIGVSPFNSASTSVIDMGWLEYAWRQDINNTALPKPVFGMEAVRNLSKTSVMAHPFNISWIPIPLAFYGDWQANTAYPSGLGVAQTPVSPVQQFIDVNGNYLFVSINGVSGNVQPAAAACSAPGVTVVDNTVTWTVADPRGVAMRVAPLPASSGIVWSIEPAYQMRPPQLTSLQDTIAPIPDELGYLFREGFMAKLMNHAKPGSRAAQDAYVKWEEALMVAVRAGDREREDCVFYPTEGLMGGVYTYLPIGPANPYNYFYGW
jgi:hypothetical protein